MGAERGAGKEVRGTSGTATRRRRKTSFFWRAAGHVTGTRAGGLGPGAGDAVKIFHFGKRGGKWTTVKNFHFGGVDESGRKWAKVGESGRKRTKVDDGEKFSREQWTGVEGSRRNAVWTVEGSGRDAVWAVEGSRRDGARRRASRGRL